MDKREVAEMAAEFEKKHGTEAFLKASLSSLTHLMVEKRICTEEELRVSFVREMMRWKG